MKDWKACERKMVELLGGVRVPVSGRHRGAGPPQPDVEHPDLSIEVKSRKDLPAPALERPGAGASSLKEAPAYPGQSSARTTSSTRTASVPKLDDLSTLLRKESKGRKV